MIQHLRLWYSTSGYDIAPQAMIQHLGPWWFSTSGHDDTAPQAIDTAPQAVIEHLRLWYSTAGCDRAPQAIDKLWWAFIFLPVLLFKFFFTDNNNNTPTRPRKRTYWTKNEEEQFYKAVQHLGVGRWMQIQSQLQTNRTRRQLKDKWQTIVKTQYNQLSQKFGPANQ